MKLDIGKDAHLTSELISTIAGDMYRRQLIHDPDFVRLFDKTWDSPLQQVLISTTGELVSALILGSDTLFSRYLSWFSVIARNAGIGEDQLRDHVRLYRLTLHDHVAPETCLKLEQLINAGEASVLRGVYTHVLQPAQNELGRLWEIGKLTPAEEHLGTAITQEVISGIDHRLFRTVRVGKGFVGADSYTVDADHAVLCAELALAALTSRSTSNLEDWPSTPTSQEPYCPANILSCLV